MKTNEMLLIGGIVLVGAFMFKDQICQSVPGIPLLCDSAMGGGPEAIIKDCVKKCGNALNEPCLKACAEQGYELLDESGNAGSAYAGYY